MGGRDGHGDMGRRAPCLIFDLVVVSGVCAGWCSGLGIRMVEPVTIPAGFALCDTSTPVAVRRLGDQRVSEPGQQADMREVSKMSATAGLALIRSGYRGTDRLWRQTRVHAEVGEI